MSALECLAAREVISEKAEKEKEPVVVESDSEEEEEIATEIEVAPPPPSPVRTTGFGRVIKSAITTRTFSSLQNGTLCM